MTARRSTLLLSLVLLAGLTVRLTGIGAKSLWFDEAISWRQTTFPAGVLIERGLVPEQRNTPLYPLLLRGWVGLWGDSEVALRSLAALFGVLTAAGMYLAVGELGRLAGRPGEAGRWRGAALTAAALVALNPFQAHLGQQARGYTLGTCLLAFNSWALLRTLRAARSGPAWLLYGGLTVALLYTHNLALFSVLPQLLFALLYRLFGPGPSAAAPDRAGADSPLWAVLALGGAAALYAPWLAHLAGQSQATEGVAMPPHLEWLPTEWLLALGGTFESPRVIPLEPALAALAVALAGLTWVCHARGWAGGFVWLCAAVPLWLVATAAVCTSHQLMYARYFAFAQLWWLAWLALLCAGRTGGRTRAGLAALLLGGSLVALWGSWREVGPHANPGMRAAAAHVLRHRREGERVVARSPFVQFGLCYYTRGQAGPRLALPPSVHGRYMPSLLRQEEEVDPDAVARADAPGLWLVSGRFNGQEAGTSIHLPPEWELVERRQFEQDYQIEGPLTVEHYRRKRTR